MRKEDEFDKLLLKNIDNSLKGIFTESAASAIYAFLESNYTLSREKIPEKLDVFDEGLRRFLSTGAFTIEKVILDNLCSDLDVKYKFAEKLDFKNSVVKLKSYLKIT